METKKLLKEFSQYVILNICGMIGLSCYILADTFFVSNGLGPNGLTALNLAIPIYSFVHGSGLMFGMGGATKYSIYRGQKAYKNADKSFSNTIYIMSALAVTFMLTGIFFSGQLTRLLGADKNVYHMTKTYIQVILLFAPAFMANDALICFVRNDGNPKLSMLGMLTGSFSNIILDYIFIFPLNMGIFGAVLATGLAPVISLIVLSKHWLTKQNQFHFVRIKPSFRLIGNIISLGVPSFITEMASGIVMIVFNTIILHLQGNIGVAAYGVVANLSLVVITIYTGIAQGTQPILSKVYGYGEHESQKQILKYALKTMLVISLGIYPFFLLTANPIVSIFNSEQNMQLQEIAAAGLKLYFTAIPFVGFNIIISAYFASIEKALPALFHTLHRKAPQCPLCCGWPIVSISPYSFDPKKIFSFPQRLPCRGHSSVHPNRFPSLDIQSPNTVMIPPVSFSASKNACLTSSGACSAMESKTPEASLPFTSLSASVLFSALSITVCAVSAKLMPVCPALVIHASV